MTAISWPLTTAGTQATAEMKATAGIKQQQDRQHSMDAIKSRNPCKNNAAGNSMEGGHSS